MYGISYAQIIIIIVIIGGRVGKSAGHFFCSGCALLCQRKNKC